jgi:hypothetical protein
MAVNPQANAMIASFSERRRAGRTCHKVALETCICKMLGIPNAVLKTKPEFDPALLKL